MPACAGTPCFTTYRWLTAASLVAGKTVNGNVNAMIVPGSGIVKEHDGWIDVERAAKVSGSRFVYRKGDFALLELALVNLADLRRHPDDIEGLLTLRTSAP